MTKIQEIWKPIKDYEGLYEVSNLGRVKRLNGRKCKSGIYSKFQTSSYRYHSLRLSKNAKSKVLLVHRLVAIAFIPNPENKPFVCHKDDNGFNNNVDNLFWGTNLDNVKDMVSKGRNSFGEKNGFAKVTKDDVIKIRKMRSGGIKLKDITSIYGITDATICAMVSRKTWKHV